MESKKIQENSQDNQNEKNKPQKSSIVYLIILLILLIFTFIISFKTGEEIYQLINTNLEDTSTDSQSQSAEWKFNARVEY